MRRRSLFVPVALGALAVVAGSLTPAAAATAPPPAEGLFHAVAPTRVIDTRQSGGAVGPGAVLKVPLSKAVPSSGAIAVVLNLTVTAPTAAGYLTVYPDGAGRPLASSINKRAGETRSNSVTVALPANGSRIVDVYNQIGSSQVVVDVTGYYDPDFLAAGATAYFARTPDRVADTRLTGGRLHPGGRLDISLPMAGALDVSAVAVTITAVDPSGQGFLTAWNGTSTQPTTSTVNYGTDPVTPNFAVVPATFADDGSTHFSIGNHGVSTDVVVDVVGEYGQATPGSSLYLPVAPTRLFDTRNAGGALKSDTSRTFTPTPPSGVAVEALNLNLTAVDATVPTYLTAYDPNLARPTASNLNPASPAAVADAAQITVNGTSIGNPSTPLINAFAVYNHSGSVDAVGDLAGYFVYLAE